MKAKYKSNKRQILALGVESFEAGDTFRKWPKHITLVPWFKGASQKMLSERLEELTARTKPLYVTLGEFALLGEKKDVPVRLIEPNPKLNSLHLAASTLARVSYGELESADSLGYKYTPHITNRDGSQLAEHYDIDRLALIEDIGNGERLVGKVFKLND